jgi:sulfate permease, SulP family
VNAPFVLLRRLAQAATPFRQWFPLRGASLRADLLAGITVALVLVPQSMAYAQLAGLPAYYGLYAAFLPVIAGALWGSSSHLSTGPVALTSLLTGSVLAPFALVGSDQFVSLAITLALMVGVFRLALGVLRFGAIVNFLPHPVLVGFTNAAALIIALSQLGKLLGIPAGRSDHFFGQVWSVLEQVPHVHLPTLLMALTALGLMWTLRTWAPRLPGVLIVVAGMALVAWSIGFEQRRIAPIDRLVDPGVRAMAASLERDQARGAELARRILERRAEAARLEREGAPRAQVLALRHQLELLQVERGELEREIHARHRTLHRVVLERVAGDAGEPGALYLAGQAPRDRPTDGRAWRIVGVADGEVRLRGGGEVVGAVPPGLPRPGLPGVTWDTVTLLFPATLVIALLGYTEAVSISKAIAVRTRQRLDPNQELIGQGLANIVGSFTQSYPVSGSFSRSALNLEAGARTGMSSVVTGLVVLVTLLFLTPLLYHIPQPVLAAVVLMAVVGLVNVRAIKHAWQVHRHDGLVATITLGATLLSAPHLHNGILIGVGLALSLYLYRTMRPRVVVLGRHPDGTWRDARLHGLPPTGRVAVVRFDGSLYFANAAYFEDAILDAVSRVPNARYVVVAGDGINEIDAAGEDLIRDLHRRLGERGVTLIFSGLKYQVLEVLERTGLFAEIGERQFFRTVDLAIAAIYEELGAPSPPAPPGARPGRATGAP